MARAEVRVLAPQKHSASPRWLRAAGGRACRQPALVPSAEAPLAEPGAAPHSLACEATAPDEQMDGALSNPQEVEPLKCADLHT